jgi:hypothetical protein
MNKNVGPEAIAAAMLNPSATHESAQLFAFALMSNTIFSRCCPRTARVDLSSRLVNWPAPSLAVRTCVAH